MVMTMIAFWLLLGIFYLVITFSTGQALPLPLPSA